MQEQNTPQNESPWKELDKVNTQENTTDTSPNAPDTPEVICQRAQEEQNPAEEITPLVQAKPDNEAEIPKAEENPPANTNISLDTLKEIIRDELKAEFNIQFTVLADQLESQFYTLSTKADSILDKDQQMQNKDDLFAKVYGDLKKHQSGLERVILMPFLKSAIKWFERVQDLMRYYEAKTPLFGSGKTAYCDLLREFGNFGEYILDTLENFDIEIIRPEEGDVFDRTSCEAVSTVPTEDAALSGTIQKCLVAGFRYSDGKIIQYAKVSVYKS